MASTRAGNTIKRVMHLIKQGQGGRAKQGAGVKASREERGGREGRAEGEN